MSTAEDLKALQEIYEGYVEIFGPEAQWKMVVEEALEFAHAAMKVDRKLRKADTNKHIIKLPFSPSHSGWRSSEMTQLLTEAVDCLIMIGQLPWITGNPEGSLFFLKKRHEGVVARMKKRLEAEAGGE